MTNYSHKNIPLTIILRLYIEKDNEQNSLSFFWCGHRDLNPDGLPYAPQTYASAYSAMTANDCIPNIILKATTCQTFLNILFQFAKICLRLFHMDRKYPNSALNLLNILFYLNKCDCFD